MLIRTVPRIAHKSIQQLKNPQDPKENFEKNFTKFSGLFLQVKHQEIPPWNFPPGNGQPDRRASNGSFVYRLTLMLSDKLNFSNELNHFH